jgi:hypothetical protein
MLKKKWIPRGSKLLRAGMEREFKNNAKKQDALNTEACTHIGADVEMNNRVNK